MTDRHSRAQERLAHRLRSKAEVVELVDAVLAVRVRLYRPELERLIDDYTAAGHLHRHSTKTILKELPHVRLAGNIVERWPTDGV